MLTVDYNEFLNFPEKYLMKGITEGVLITKNGYSFVKLSRPKDRKPSFKNLRGILRIEDLDLNDPLAQKYLNS
jgi:hypothetical protein